MTTCTARIQLKHKVGNSSPTVANTDKSGSRVKDEDIVQVAERDAADGVSEDENDTDEDSEDEGEGGSRSFVAITHQFEKDAEADSGSESDDEDTESLNNQPSTQTTCQVLLVAISILVRRRQLPLQTCSTGLSKLGGTHSGYREWMTFHRI